MRKILSGFITLVFLSQMVVTFAATPDNCRQYAYGYMADGKVYMMLAGKKYGPFQDVNQLKFTLERMWPQFAENLKQYMYLDPNGGPDKYVVYRNELGDCNPYVLDMETVTLWNSKVTALFRQLNVRFQNDHWWYKTAMTNAITIVNNRMNSWKGSQKTYEILRLVRDRFVAKLQSL